jgi:hypothetical protein
MRFLSWLRNGTLSQAHASGRAHGAPRQRATFRPRLEALEDRCVPSTLTVSNNLDTGFTGDGSLRGEIAAAAQSGGDTIVFAPSLAGKTIFLNFQLVIDRSLTIQGPGAANLAISGEGGDRVFDVAAGAQVTLSGLTIENGHAGSGGYGGSILNYGTLTVTGCLVSGDSVNSNAYYGGGIYNAGTLTVSGSTVTRNIAQGAGGGIYNAGTLTVSGSTVTQNINDDGGGGGIFNRGTLTVLDSTVINNIANERHHGFVEQDVFTDHQFTYSKDSTIGKVAYF